MGNGALVEERRVVSKFRSDDMGDGHGDLEHGS